MKSHPSGVVLGVVERPLLHELLEAIEVCLFEQLVVIAAEVFFVPHGTFGHQFQYVVVAVGADSHRQAAEKVVSPAGPHAEVVADNRAAPSLVLDDRLITETGEVVGKLFEAALNMVCKAVAIVRV